MARFQSNDGLSLHYLDEGDGLPLLCLPGLTRPAEDFDFVLPHLSGVRSIRPDYRGRGRSDWAPDWKTYTVAQEAADILSLLDHLGIGRAAILGTSRGGLIAMFLSATAKDRIVGIALNDIGPMIEPAGLERIADYLGRNPGFATRSAMASAMPAMSPGFTGVAPSRWMDHVARLYDETPDGLRIRYDPHLRDAFLALAGKPAPDLWPMFEAMAGLPLALIRGANSDLLSRDTALEMIRRRPDLIFAEVPGRGHVPWLDEPEAVDALARWLGAMR